MRHIKKSALFVLCVIVAFFLLFAFTEGLAGLLIFPVIALVGFAALYLVRQGEQDIENNIKDGVRYTVEEQEAEQWIKHDLAPRTVSYIKHRHWPVIIYSFLFVIGIAYVWSLLTSGEEIALQNTIFAAVLFVIFIGYVFIAPRIFNWFFKHIPPKQRKIARNDWIRGYLFLLPLTAVSYILSPFIGSNAAMWGRVAAIPGFLFGYTLLFLCGYAIIYLHKETKKEEEKALKKSIKDYLNEKP